MSSTGQSQPVVLGYALNAFPYHTLTELWPVLETDVLAIKQRVFPDAPFPIELRVSAPIVAELTRDPATVTRLREFFTAHELALVSLNAFVMPRFHGQPVKEQVYLPAWHTGTERLAFTNHSIDLLAQLGDARLGSVLSASVPFGALKPVSMEQIAPHILAAGAHARQVHERTGRWCVVGLEPEPGLTVETTPEIIRFFDAFVPAELRAYLTVNFDLSHQLVQFEDPLDSLEQLHAHDIRVSKVHVSNPAEMTQLEKFYEDSIYLHQTVGIDQHGERVLFSLDWPATPPPAAATCFRVHYHLPVFPSAFPSAIEAVARFLSGLPRTPYFCETRSTVDPHPPVTVPLIIETYTWPQQTGPAERHGHQYLPGTAVDGFKVLPCSSRSDDYNEKCSRRRLV